MSLLTEIEIFALEGVVPRLYRTRVDKGNMFFGKRNAQISVLMDALSVKIESLSEQQLLKALRFVFACLTSKRFYNLVAR